MKRILSFVLAVSLVLGLSAVGFAAEGETVGMSATMSGTQEGGTLSVSKSTNDPGLEGYTWELVSSSEPESVQLNLLSDNLSAKILTSAEQDGVWKSQVRTYGLEQHRFSESHVGRVFSGTLTVSFKDGSSAEWKVELTVTDEAHDMDMPYMAVGNYAAGEPPVRNLYLPNQQWTSSITFNYKGVNGYPFTLFSEQPAAAVEVTFRGQKVEKDFEKQQQVEVDGVYRSAYWFGLECNYTKEDVGKTYPGEIAVTWEDGSSTTFGFAVKVTDSARYNLKILDAGGNEVDRWDLQLGKAYTAKLNIIDANGVLGQNHAGEKLTVKWAAESGNDHISVPADSFVPHDSKGIPTAFSYGDDPASYVIPEDTAGLEGAELPFGMAFTAEAVGEFDLRYEVYVAGNRVQSSGFGHQIKGNVEPVESGRITDLFQAADSKDEKKVVIPVQTGEGLYSSAFEEIIKQAEKTGINEVTIDVLGRGENSEKKASLTFNVQELDESFLKKLENSGGAYNPAVDLDIPDAAKNHGYSHGQWLDFAHSGALPAPMTVTVDVQDAFGADVKELTLWRYRDNRLVQDGTTVKLEDGQATFTLTHCSAWALYPVGYNPNPDTDSSDDDDSSSDSSEADFSWASARGQVKSAKAGSTVRLGLPAGEKIPASLLRALAEKDNVTLVLRQNGKTLKLHSGDIGQLEKSEYRFSELQALFGGAQGGGSAEAGSDKSNPGTGAGEHMGAALLLSACGLLLVRRLRG